MAYEDLFAKRGEGYKLIREGQTYIDGLILLNVDGGLRAKGHLIGATGVSTIAELMKQLRQQVERGRQATIKTARRWRTTWAEPGTTPS